MSDEIKEILNKLSNRKQETLIQGIRELQLKDIEHPFITKEEYIDKILDYITDLQEELKSANESITWWSNRFKAVERDNRFLKLNNPEQNLEHFRIIKENKRKIDNLRAENERLKKELKSIKSNFKIQLEYDEELEDYKSRCEKAVEFIEEKISSTNGVIDDYMYHKEHNKHLIELLNEDVEMYKNELNILQGSDKNEIQNER